MGVAGPGCRSQTDQAQIRLDRSAVWHSWPAPGALAEFTGQCCCIYSTCRHIRPLPSDMLNSRNSKPRYNRRKPAKGTAYIPLGRICHVAQTYNYNTLGKMGKCHVSTCRILGQVAVQKCQVSPVHTWQRMGDIRKRMQKPDTSSG